MKLVMMLAGALLLLTAWPGARAQTGGIVGRWDLTVQGTDAPYSSWLEVVPGREPGTYNGRFVGRFGSVRPIARVTFKGDQLDFTLPPQYEQRTTPLVFTGRLIGERLEGTTVAEDGARINWTAVRAPDLKPARMPSWGKPVALFNGRDLSGWRLRSEKGAGCWTVEEGALTNRIPCVDLISEQKFTDFKLHVEFKLAEKSNSGIYLRGRYEVQILDDPGKGPDSLGMGGVYGYLRPGVVASLRAGEWQTYDITLIGRFISVTLNGKNLYDGLEIPGLTGGAIDSDEGAPGPLMLQGDHGKIWFREITITPAK